jgi:hypothetical protein
MIYLELPGDGYIKEKKILHLNIEGNNKKTVVKTV